MLAELLVENYAVIERVRVRFHRGLNLLTGETGSGKSIVVDALGLLLGGRASPDMIRTDAERARVAGIIELPEGRAIRTLLDEAGIEPEDNELLIEREILANGKSRAFLGSRPVTLTLLKELAPYVGDIHGQHEQQQLFSAAAQREMLDEFAGADDLVEQVAVLYEAWRKTAAELEELERSEQERLRLADLWAFQRKEIEGIAPKPGEDAELENERRVLRNVAKLEEAANAAYSALYDSPDSASAQLRAALRKAEELARIDESLAAVVEVLKPAAIGVEDAAHALRDYLGRLEADPARLEEVEARLAALDKLKRKYGTKLEDVGAFLEDIRSRLAGAESAEERRTALEKERGKLAAEYETAAVRLSARRKDAARDLTKRTEAELATLAMEGSRFRVELGEGPWSAAGRDTAAFLISPNVGEEPRPLEKIASGGELSRIALALKTCATGKTAKAGVPRTLVFDEIDAGIGGAAAEAVGRRLKKLAAAHQVLCVTHLPQIAGFADHHYVVDKRESGRRTVATVDELDEAGRRREIGRMLSGEKLTLEALRFAEKLLSRK